MIEQRRRIELPLVNGLKNAAEDLLRLGAARRAIAAADFAGDDGGAQRVFGAPVRRVSGPRHGGVGGASFQRIVSRPCAHPSMDNQLSAHHNRVFSKQCYDTFCVTNCSTKSIMPRYIM